MDHQARKRAEALTAQYDAAFKRVEAVIAARDRKAYLQGMRILIQQWRPVIDSDGLRDLSKRFHAALAQNHGQGS